MEYWETRPRANVTSLPPAARGRAKERGRVSKFHARWHEEHVATKNGTNLTGSQLSVHARLVG